MEKLIITPKTKFYDLLEAYLELEDLRSAWLRSLSNLKILFEKDIAKGCKYKSGGLP